MKTFRLIGMALVAMCLCMNFASCSNEDVVAPEDPQEEKYVTVGLGCTGEFLEFSNSPLSRTTAEELYGIQVYSLTERTSGDADGSETYYVETPYAHGMFTSLEDVTIKLLQGQNYRFKVSIVIDPFKKGNDYWFYEYYNDYYNVKGTEFTYSTTHTLELTWVNYTTDYDNQHDYDRYYGELETYTPAENGNVDIYTKRVAYGVRYETTGLGADESITVEVTGGQYHSGYLYEVELTSEPNEGIYTFSRIWEAWKGKGVWNEMTGVTDYENYSWEKKLTLSWNKADGEIIPMGTYAVTFKRNVKTTIKIKAENLNMANGIRVFKEEVSMVDDENIYEIEGGTVTEVPVTSGN